MLIIIRLLSFNFAFYLCLVKECVCACDMCVWLPRGKRKALEFLELNLQAAVS